MIDWKVTPDQFKRIWKLVMKAAKEKPYDGSDLVEARKLTLGHPIVVPLKPDMDKVTGGRGNVSFGIPAGEWSLLKAIQEGK